MGFFPFFISNYFITNLPSEHNLLSNFRAESSSIINNIKFQLFQKCFQNVETVLLTQLNASILYR